MSRRLSPEERALWDRLRKSVRPLREGEQEAKALPVEPGPVAAKKARRPPPAKLAPAPAREKPPLAAIEPRARRRLVRGTADVDARIDLHGMRQDRAFSALVSFLRAAQARDERLVLVITGKGLPTREGRGVLRQMVPEWLARPDLRELVLGFEEAGRRHGAAGALYVRLRRPVAARRRRNDRGSAG